MIDTIKLFRIITCDKLRQLNCSHNKLSYLPNDLSMSDILQQHFLMKPKNKLSLPWSCLQILDCSNNSLICLPDILPQSLHTLNCSDNILAHLPVVLSQSLHTLNCSYNKLTRLPVSLPQTLQMLDCSNNKLTRLPDALPQILRQFSCYRNNLTQLPDILPQSLKILQCDRNKLTNLPMSIIRCYLLEQISYDNNPLDILSPIIRRFLDRPRAKSNDPLKVYNDTQSVHNHNIQVSISISIGNILKDEIFLTEKIVREQIMKDPILTATAKERITKYCIDNTTHSVLMITFEDLLLYVWQRIVRHAQRDELKKILNQELADSQSKCFTGRLSRLLNCLNGFYNDINIKIEDSEQIGNIIVMIKEQLGDSYTVEKHKELVEKELLERGYDKTVIDEWLSFIES